MEEDEQADRTLPEWVELEYLHMRTLAGPEAQIHFSHLSSSSSKALSSVFVDSDFTHEASVPSNSSRSLANATAHQMGVLELMKAHNLSLDQVCLLDPKAENELSPQDGDGTFQWFLFGGILGDDPPRDRTAELRKLGFPTRHLGNVQMTTDTALGVTKKVVHDRVKLQDIPYVDFPTIRFNAQESVEMPFRYIAIDAGNGKREPLLPPGMRDLLHKDLDKGFEF
ncbi:DUF431-domain-containing protein [Fomitiporia mediterranea MF3/22]|uniref:DUF431-domain-containing protein n=1 Tax=Fomitiporia mediterranea (strain MF3/22) TaxID=694068 RepID=UPI00044089CB|nr:DUF431-domain-containing protein [Fomitiporia mediterranea MF3/22]EJD01813.1 DUF431-domain-containing protein [Fomitiporia mediterranea MF3/22]